MFGAQIVNTLILVALGAKIWKIESDAVDMKRTARDFLRFKNFPAMLLFNLSINCFIKFIKPLDKNYRCLKKMLIFRYEQLIC